MKKFRKVILKCAFVFVCVFFVWGGAACSTDSDDDGVSVSLNKSSLSLNKGAEFTLVATVKGLADTSVTWKSSDSNVATVNGGIVTAKANGEAIITATSDADSSKSATCRVFVGVYVIHASDTPTGWAGYTGTKDLAGNSVSAPAQYGGYGASSSKIYTVSTSSELKSALSGTSSKIIYIDGMIDMTDEMLPSSASASTSALDNWIEQTASSLTDSKKYGDVAQKVTSLSTWKSWYASGNTNSADESGVYKAARSKLSSDYGNKIKLTVPSNTTIIGLGSSSGIKGGCIKISNAKNIVIRNLTLQDSFDPFPQIEKGDGFNANWDVIEISNQSKYIWIDHCTLQDTIATTDNDFDHITLKDGTELKYQVFDGLCDIKQASDFITVSYCKFMNHDKTSLIGHDGKYTADRNHQTITLHNNYYYNCKQRLPMVRFATIHIYNNYYTSSGGRGNSYCIGLREENRVYAENNYFGNGVTPVSNSQGSFYFTGNNKNNNGSVVWKPSNYYSYTPLTASEAKSDVESNAGAGVWTVQQ